MPIVLTILQNAIELALATVFVAGGAWLWRYGKALRATLKRIVAATEAQAAENARLYARIKKLLELDDRQTQLAGQLVDVLQELIDRSRSTADGGMLPAQRLEQHIASLSRLPPSAEP